MGLEELALAFLKYRIWAVVRQWKWREEYKINIRLLKNSGCLLSIKISAIISKVGFDQPMGPAMQLKFAADLPPADTFEKIEIFFLNIGKISAPCCFTSRYSRKNQFAACPAPVSL